MYVVTKRSEIDEVPSTLKSAIDAIETNLKFSEWMKEWKCGSTENPYWNMVFRGTLSESDKEAITILYTAAGWTVTR